MSTAPQSTIDSATQALPRRRLGDLLVDIGLITPTDLARALDEQRRTGLRLGEQLVADGAITERALADALGAQLALPVVDFAAVTPTPEALASLTEVTVRTLGVLPVSLDAGLLQVAVADPTVAGLTEKLVEASRLRVSLCVAAPFDLRRAIDATFRSFAAIEALGRQFTSPDAPPPDTEAAPVVRVCDLLLVQAVRDRASDVHVLPSENRVRVRFRIDGQLLDVVNLPAGMGPAIVSRLKVLAGLNIAERRLPLDGQFSTHVDDTRIDVRLSTSPTVAGEKAVLRLLASDRRPRKLADLGLAGAALDSYHEMLQEPFGMILCVGPTGAGKTSTLYATVAELDTPDCNIVTIEDPVEFTVPSISQIQINEQAGLTFATGLRSILRQDPDVVLVGEVRDGETARIATQAALTGHMVLSSLHATDAVGAVYRLLDMGVEPFLVGASVLGVSAQRLVRRVCYACAVPAQLNPAEEKIAARHLDGSVEPRFIVGAGCNLCHHTGFQGRIGVFEVLTLNSDMREAITAGAGRTTLSRLAKAAGMHSLHDQAFALAASGATTLTEALRVAGDAGEV
jgi:type IV pilus assembly protein PilB